MSTSDDAVSTPVLIRRQLQAARDRALDVLYAWQIERAEQHPSLNLHVNPQTRIGWAVARSRSVYVEIHRDPQGAPHRRWRAWTVMHLPGATSMRVEAPGLTPAAAVRKVRHALMQELYQFHPEGVREP